MAIKIYQKHFQKPYTLYPKPYNHGFTLVELSIVIVIIGLLVAGVMSGRSLVQNSKLQNVIKELKELETAVIQFKDKFKYYPGDIPNATTYWTGGITGNGNDDWFIALTDIHYAENYRTFQHLSLAGFISGNFTGTGGSGLTVIGTNSPKSIYKNTATYFFYSNTLWNNYKRGNSLTMCGTGGSGWNDPKVNVIDAYNIDTKIDDGKPYIGQIITYSIIDGACVASGQRLSVPPADLSAVTYNLINNTALCVMHYGLDAYTFVKK